MVSIITLPSTLNPATEVFPTDAFVVDDGTGILKCTATQIVDAGRPNASEAEAVAGTDNFLRMSPLRVKQAIAGSDIAADAAAAVVIAEAAAASAEATVAVVGRTLASFGAVGDAVISNGTLSSGTDDTAAIQAAFTWMAAASDRKLLDNSGNTYLITAMISHSGNLQGDLSGAKFFFNANVTGFEFNNTPAGPFALSSNYAGGTVLATGSTGTAAAVGTRLLVLSNAVDPANSDCGSDVRQYRCGEQTFAALGSTTTSINLQKPLRFTVGISPTSTAGDEARIAAYDTAYGARVMVFNDANGIDIDLGQIEYAAGNEATWKNPAVVVNGYANGQVTARINRGYQAGIRLQGCFNVDAYSQPHNLTDNTPNGQFGYGVATAGCLNCRVHIKDASRVRHAYTSSAAGQAANETSLGRYLCQGRDAGTRIIGGFCADNPLSGPWDTHHESTDTVFDGCTAVGGGAHGIGIRGRNVTHRNSVIRGCARGGIIFTEYSSGETDDDFWTAGKTKDDITLGNLENIDWEVTGRAVDVAVCFASVFGQNRIVATSDSPLRCEGGDLGIYGNTTITIRPGGTVNSVGLLHCVAATTTLETAIGNKGIITVARGAVLTIDATADTATGRVGLLATANARIRVLGRLRVLLPATGELLSATGEIWCDEAGVIEFSRVGDPTYLPANLTGRVLRVVRTTGETIWDSVPKNVVVDNAEVLGFGYGVATVSGDAPKMRIRDTDAALSNGELAGSLEFLTNDSDGTADFVAGAVRLYARGTTGAGEIATEISGVETCRNTTGGFQMLATTSNPLGINGQVGFEIVSNTSLRVKLRGTDGVTRIATLTLA